MEKLLLKPSEVAEVLGIGRSLTYELIAQKQIPSVRLGRCIRVQISTLRDWLAKQQADQKTNQELSGTPEEATVSG